MDSKKKLKLPPCAGCGLKRPKDKLGLSDFGTFYCGPCLDRLAEIERSVKCMNPSDNRNNWKRN